MQGFFFDSTDRLILENRAVMNRIILGSTFFPNDVCSLIRPAFYDVYILVYVLTYQIFSLI